jgi:anti-sigma-K factor RskA
VNYDRPELLERLAAEYVFGTMTGRARRRFDRLRLTLPAADAAATTWEVRSAALARSVPPATPSPQLWSAIDRRTGGSGAEGASPRARRGWWAWLAPVAGLAFGVLATIGVVRLAPDALVPIDEIVQQRGTLPQSYVGLLTDPSGAATILASSTRHGRTMSIKVLRPVDAPPGTVLQLWALPRDGEPFPLGVVPREGKGSFEMADTSEKLLSSVPRLAVSIEARPASKGAAPSGFILTGHCVKLW